MLLNILNTKNNILLKRYQRIFFQCPNQFQGKRITIIFSGVPPSIYLKKGFRLTGIDIELAKNMAQKFGFKPRFKVMPYKGYDFELGGYPDAADIKRVIET